MVWQWRIGNKKLNRSHKDREVASQVSRSLCLLSTPWEFCFSRCWFRGWNTHSLSHFRNMQLLFQPRIHRHPTSEVLPAAAETLVRLESWRPNIPKTKAMLEGLTSWRKSTSNSPSIGSDYSGSNTKFKQIELLRRMDYHLNNSPPLIYWPGAN